MKKLPLSLVAASVSVIAAQAHAKTEIQINESLVDYSSIDDLTQAFHDSASDMFLNTNLEDFATAMTLDNKKLEISESEVGLLASLYARDQDSTSFSSGSVTNNTCYNNCYDNCHGSRGWR